MTDCPLDHEALHLELLGKHGVGGGGHQGRLLLVVAGDGPAAGNPPKVVHGTDDGAGVRITHILKEAVNPIGGTHLEALMDRHCLVVKGLVKAQILLQPFNLEVHWLCVIHGLSAQRKQPALNGLATQNSVFHLKTLYINCRKY